MTKVKLKTLFVCQECGYQSPRWSGKCPGCNSWNTLVEELEEGQSTRYSGNIFFDSSKDAQPIAISDIQSEEDNRLLTGIEELDRVLGGGIVPASVVLVGGDPGVGKSTLLLEALGELAKRGFKVLYITGEESTGQVKLRGERLRIESPNLLVIAQTNVNLLAEMVRKFDPKVIVVDSIQVMYIPELTSTPGSVSQVRECGYNIISIAKSSRKPIFLIGHVTKEGTIAGPKILEHMVDTVLYFEGDNNSNLRILRAVKNRFGPTNEIGVFQMQGSGLVEVKNPSEEFLSGSVHDISGSIIVPTMEGTRPILVEIQALVTRTNFGIPTRRTICLDCNRVTMLIAVLEKRMSFRLSDKDVFVNVAGGIRITEPYVDLAVVLAIASNLKDKPLPKNTIAIGEVGLAGEVRRCPQIDVRIKEAMKFGFEQYIVPASNAKEMGAIADDVDVVGIHDIGEALRKCGVASREKM